MAAESASSSLSRLRAPSLVTVLGLAFVLVIALWLVVNLIKTPADFFEVTAIGITNGSVYALVARIASAPFPGSALPCAYLVA